LLISVIMPAYNAEPFIYDAIESILNQSYCDFEFIIVNDGSSDSTADIVNSFNDPRIIFIDRKENKGLVYSLNEAIEFAHGDFIARMDADDVSMTNRFELQIKYMQEHPEVDICGGAYKCFGELDDLYECIVGTEKIAECLFHLCVIAHPTVMMRRRVVYKVDLYDQDYLYAEDYELWCRLLKRGAKFANIPNVLLNYRVSNGHISSKHHVRQRFLSKVIVLRNLAWDKDIEFIDKIAVGNYGENYCCKKLEELHSKVNDKDHEEKQIFADLCYFFVRLKQERLIDKVRWYYKILPICPRNIYRSLKIIVGAFYYENNKGVRTS